MASRSTRKRQSSPLRRSDRKKTKTWKAAAEEQAARRSDGSVETSRMILSKAFLGPTDSELPLTRVKTATAVSSDIKLSAVKQVAQIIEVAGANILVHGMSPLILHTLQDLAEHQVGRAGPEKLWSTKLCTILNEDRTDREQEPDLQLVGRISDGQTQWSWQLTMIDNMEEEHHFSATKESLSGIDVKDVNVLRGIATALQTILNAWPYGPLESESLKRQVFLAAQYAATGTGPAVPSPVWDETRGLVLNLRHIDPDDDAEHWHQISSKLPFVFNDLPATIPAAANFYVSSEGDTRLLHKAFQAETVEWESVIPTDFADHDLWRDTRSTSKPSRADMEGREQLLRFMAHRCQGMIASADGVDRVLAIIEATHSFEALQQPKHTATLPTIPGFLDVQWARDRPRSTTFVLNPAVGKALGADWKSIRRGRHHILVSTVDGRRIAKIISVAKESLLRHYDVKRALRVMAEAIDEAHEAIHFGIEPTGICACDNGHETEHLCATCSNSFPCSKLSLDKHGLRQCKACEPHAHKVSVADRIFGSAFMALQRDGLRLGDPMPDEEVERRASELASHLSGFHLSTDTQYREHYSLERITPEAGDVAYLPSVDAIHPFGGPKLTDLRFTVTNTVVTSALMSMLHGSFPIGIVKLAIDFSRSGLTASAEHILITRTRDMMLLAHLQPDVDLSNAQHRVLYHQLKMGKALSAVASDKAVVAYERLRRAGKGAAVCLWTLKQRQNIIDICEEIQGYRGTLRRAADGAIWPSQWGKIPPGYDWDWSWTIAHDLLLALKTETYLPRPIAEDEMTIWCEIIFQLHRAASSRGSLLCLPTLPWVGGPLAPTLTFRKAHNSDHVFTGWSMNPSKLSHRINVANNVSMLARMDAMGTYVARLSPATRSMHKNIWGNSETTRWYNPDAQLDFSRELRQSSVKLVVKQEISVPGYLHDAAVIAGVPAEAYDHVEIARQRLLAAAKVVRATTYPTPDRDSQIIGVLLQRERGHGQSSEQPPMQPANKAFDRPTRPERPRPAPEVELESNSIISLAISKIAECYKQQHIPDQTVPVGFDTRQGRRVLPPLLDLDAYKSPASARDNRAAYMSTDMLMTAMQSTVLEHGTLPHIHPLEINTAQFYLGVVGEHNDISQVIAMHLDDISEQPWLAAGMPRHCTEVHTIMNEHGSHFIHVSFVVDPRTRTGTIYVRDSLPGSRVLSWLHDYSRLFTASANSPWSEVEFAPQPVAIDCPRQPDTYNCGPFAFASWHAAVTGGPVVRLDGDEQAKLHAGRLRAQLIGNVYELATALPFSALLSPHQTAVLHGNIHPPLFGMRVPKTPSNVIASATGSNTLAPVSGTPGSSSETQDPLISTVPTTIVASHLATPSTNPLASMRAKLTKLPTFSAWLSAQDSTDDTPRSATPALELDFESSDTTLCKLFMQRYLDYESFKVAFLQEMQHKDIGDEDERMHFVYKVMLYSYRISTLLRSLRPGNISYDPSRMWFICEEGRYEVKAGYDMLRRFSRNYGMTTSLEWPEWYED